MRPRLPEPSTTTSRSETSFLGLLLRRAGRLADGEADHRVLLVAARDTRDVAPRERALDELVEAVAVALLERRPLRLPVVGEDDDLVRARRVAARALDMAEVVVELAQRLEGVGALEARVVRDLVVAREGRVDGGAPAHHVGEHARHDQVAHEDAERAPHERVDAAAVAARPHVPADCAQRGSPLQDDLPAEEDERAGRVVAVREERPVAGVGLLLCLHPADGEDHVVGLTGEQVSAAGAPVDEQADARPRRRSISAQSGGAEHVISVAVSFSTQRKAEMSSFEPRRMPAWLAPVCEERSVSHSVSRCVSRAQRPCRGIAVAHRAAQHGKREAVDLEEDDPGDVGARDDPLSLARSDARCGSTPCRPSRRARRARRSRPRRPALPEAPSRSCRPSARRRSTRRRP